MKLIIDIDEETYKKCKWKNNGVVGLEWWERAIANGTPIPDNATNGDVIRAMFPQWRIIDDVKEDMVMFNIPMKVGYEFNACSREWWNAPY